MKKYDIYLFDFDGTLFDTFDSLFYVFYKSFQDIGVEFKKEETPYFARVTLEEGYKSKNIPMSLWEKYCEGIEKYVNDKETNKLAYPFKETFEVLYKLKTQGKRFGIVTNNNSNHIKDVLKENGINTALFDSYIGNKECKKFKPLPDPIFMALEQMNYHGSLEKVCYVGDGMNDMKCANNAKVDAILVDRINEHPESNDYLKIKDLNELLY